MRWLERERGRRFDDYASLWRWSVEDLEGFWSALWEYFGIRASVPPARALGRRHHAGCGVVSRVRGSTTRRTCCARARPGHEALVHFREGQPSRRVCPGTNSLAGVRRLAAALRELGIVNGDRVVGCLPNTPHAVVAMLATTSIGAIWSGCGPDFGARGVLDRFSQLTPKLMFCVDGYRYGGKAFEPPRGDARGIVEALPTLEHVVLVPYLHPTTGDRCAPARAALGRSDRLRRPWRQANSNSSR